MKTLMKLRHTILSFAKALLAAVLVSSSVNSLAQTTLGTAAAALEPGRWSVFNRSGDASGYNYDLIVSCTGTDCADNILNYSAKGLWNPNTREIHFLGQGHGGRLMKHISYSDASSRWTLEAKPSWDCSPNPTCYSIGHGYEHSTIDPTTGTIYARKFNNTEVYKWMRSTKTWSALPPAPNPAVVVSLEWFPEMNGFLMVGGGQIHLYSEATKAWRSLATGLTMGDYSNVASYNPLHKVAIVGGGVGSRALYRVGSDGSVTRIADAPGDVGIFGGLLTTDPVSGKVLLFTAAGTVHEYDIPSNRWSTLSSSIPLWNATNTLKIMFRVAVPISTYGVIAFLTTNGEASTNVYLYRHSPGTGASVDNPPPAPPTGVLLR